MQVYPSPPPRATPVCPFPGKPFYLRNIPRRLPGAPVKSDK